MTVTMYKGESVAEVPASKVEHYERLGYSRDEPVKRKSRKKPPVTEGGSDNGENQG